MTRKRRPTAVEVLDAIREAAARLRRQKEEARQQAIKAAERSRRILEANEKAKAKTKQKRKRKPKEEPFTIDPSRLQLKNTVNLPCEHRVCMCNVNGFCGHRECPTGQRIIPQPNN